MTDNNKALKNAGLKVTLPRLKILEVLQDPECHHVSAEDLYKKLIDIGEEIGLATVYRVLNQFDDAGIVTRHNFEGGKSVFELTQQHHHDHLICLDCGKVIEFTDEAIEVRQRNIAERMVSNFLIIAFIYTATVLKVIVKKIAMHMMRNNSFWIISA